VEIAYIAGPRSLGRPASRSTGRLADRAPGRQGIERDRRFGAAALVFLVVALAFGGATHGDALSSAVVRLASLPLLGVAIWRLAQTPQSIRAQLAIWLLFGAFLVPLLQLIPLPPDIWSGLPGRGFVITDYRSAGIAPPWLPVSLTPYETADALLGLLPPAAMFIAALTLDAQWRRRMVLAIPLFALLAVGLGMMQVAGGEESSLRLYVVTNTDSGVGFFANRNHQAALLVTAVALAPQWMTAFRDHADGRGRFGLFLAFAIELVLIVGIGVTRSRAGVLLAAPAIVGGVLVAVGQGGDKTFRRSALALLGAAVVGSGLVGVFASSRLIDRFQAPLSADARLQALPAIEHAARNFAPVGSGLGSFDPVYRMYEPIGAVSDVYLNHAHNDWLELWLETGVAGLFVVGAFVLWWLWATIRLWRPGLRARGDGVRAAASLVIGLFLVHSTVDYPLRTAALVSVLALACGILAAPGDPAPRPASVQNWE
jgi:O-antigen ligase